MKTNFFLKFKRGILGFVFIFLTSAVFGQVVVTGKVADENGESLPGVTVMVKGTNTGTITDIDGIYSLKLPDEAQVLIFSYIGVKTQEVEIAGQTSIDIILQEDMTDLDEVVVVGYTSRKKSNITGAVSIIDMSDLEKTRIPNVSKAMQG